MDDITRDRMDNSIPYLHTILNKDALEKLVNKCAREGKDVYHLYPKTTKLNAIPNWIVSRLGVSNE